MAYRHAVFRSETKGPTELCHSTPHMLHPQLDFMGSLGGDPSKINHCTISLLVIPAPYKLWTEGGCKEELSISYLQGFLGPQVKKNLGLEPSYWCFVP